MTYQLHHGDCLNIMPLIERESVDAVICDPPYGLGFMGKDWDHGVPGMHFWLEALRCAKPGAYLLAFGGDRTHHRLMVAIEDAGWEIRTCIYWIFGQGFPKSLNVSKQIDKQAGAEREVIGRAAGMGKQNPEWNGTAQGRSDNFFKPEYDVTQPATPAAAEWDGWGTALKPAAEIIIVARKPLQGTVAENVQRYGTGAMNIDACRIETKEERRRNARGGDNGLIGSDTFRIRERRMDDMPQTAGRWPANLIHDGSAEVLAGFPMTTTGKPTIGHTVTTDNIYGAYSQRSITGGGDTGSAARFFYCAKASKADRDEGLERFELRGGTFGQKRCAKCGRQAINVSGTCQCDEPEWIEGDEISKVRNYHPTVKPTALMRYLCRLVTPPNGVILDPFMGSGSTGKAAMLEGFNFIGIDTEIEYVEIAARRIEHACEKVGIVVDQPMMFETRRETVDKPKQLILL